MPVDQLSIQLGTLSGADWKAESVQLSVRWREGQSGSYTLSADNLFHPSLPFPLLAPQFDCETGVVDDHLVSCEQGQLKIANSMLDNDSFPLVFRWERAQQSFNLASEQIGLAGGTLKFRFSGVLPEWKLEVTGQNISIQGLRKPLAMLGIAIPELKLQGTSDIDLTLSGTDALQTAGWNLRTRQVAFSAPGGDYIGEGLAGDWRGELRAARQGYSGSSRLTLRQGAILTPFLYLEPVGQALEIETDHYLDKTLSKLQFKQFEYRDPQVIALSAAGDVELAPLLRVGRLQIHSQPLQMGRVYSKYLQPVLVDEFFETLRISGGAQFEFEFDSVSTLRLELNDTEIRQGSTEADGGSENIRLSGLEGKLFWNSGDSAPRSTLKWREGALLDKIQIGSGESFFKLRGGAIQLDEPFTLPVLDGELRAERFSVNQTGSGSRVDFQGYITPISMKLVSAALGWPPLAGQLSGMIPGVSFEEGLLKLQGITLIRAFDGTILLKNLQLDDLFGPLPILRADVELKALDLQTLTSTFSFGKITGRLGGQIKGLRLEQWRPVAFDASFATPEKDPGPHRISQKAVDNISNLGGMGISGALSRSYLRFFEEFGYEKLGISCRLENGVCEMGGIESASKGYYLVKGGGLPRIDIVGFNRKTDWNLLVDKLKQVADGGAPIIQ